MVAELEEGRIVVVRSCVLVERRTAADVLVMLLVEFHASVLEVGPEVRLAALASVVVVLPSLSGAVVDAAMPVTDPVVLADVVAKVVFDVVRDVVSGVTVESPPSLASVGETLVASAALVVRAGSVVLVVPKTGFGGGVAAQLEVAVLAMEIVREGM